MVLKNEVSVIVMVKNMIEKEKVKCNKYYKNWKESEDFGDMKIKWNKKKELKIKKDRKIVMMKGKKKRKL